METSRSRGRREAGVTHRAGHSRLNIRLALQAAEATGQSSDELWLCPEEVHLLMPVGTGTKGLQAKPVCGPRLLQE